MFYPGAISFDKPIRPISSFSELDYPYPTKTWTSPQGHHLAYGMIGSGEQDILLIHGLGSYGPSWIKLVDELPANFRSIVIDLPGHGHAPLDAFKVDMEEYVRLILAFIRALDIERPIVAGHSLGGQIAMHLALDQASLVSGLILIAPYGLEVFEKQERELLLQAYDPTRMRMSGVSEIQEQFSRNFYNLSNEVSFLLRHRYQMQYAREFPEYCRMIPDCVRTKVEHPVHDRISEIKCPVLCVFGRVDQIIPHTWLHGGSVERLIGESFRNCENVRTELIDRAGHYVHFERAKKTKDAILEWYQSSEL